MFVIGNINCDITLAMETGQILIIFFHFLDVKQHFFSYRRSILECLVVSKLNSLQLRLPALKAGGKVPIEGTL